MFSVNTNSEYADQMRRFFQQSFPYNAIKNTGDILELVTDALVATGKVRLGPKPNVESLYAMRQHVRQMVAMQQPIRFLMPWGSEKPVDNQTVDLAEVAAIKTIHCLQDRVQAVYSPGIHVRIRVEDATAPSLLVDDQAQARMNAAIYTSSFLRLLTTLGANNFIEAVPESTMITEAKFEYHFQPIFQLMLEYLRESEEEIRSGILVTDFPSYTELTKLGWRSEVPIEQREHYRATYRRLYNYDDRQSTVMLARYLAQALTRRRLDMMGNKDWNQGEFLGLTFVGPVPGEPKQLSNTRLYYRTLPEHISTMHIAPWRAKGYFAVSNDNIRVRLSSWGEVRQYASHTIELENKASGTSVTVQADYEIN
jgi:hypothetical protein